MKTTAAIALAGLAAPALAQGVTFYFDADTSTATVGDTVTWTVSAEFTGYDDPSAYFGGFMGGFSANDASLATAGNFQGLLSGNATPPAGSGADVSAINIFNSALLNTDDPANPIAIFRFDATIDAFGAYRYTAATGTASVFPNDGFFTLADEFTNISIISDTVNFPTPGAAAGLLMGIAASSRRRR